MRSYSKRLAPCPHCNGEAQFHDHSRTVIGGQTAIVCYARCPTCDARGKRVRIADYATKAEAVATAIDAWNRRDGMTEQPAEKPDFYRGGKPVEYGCPFD